MRTEWYFDRFCGMRVAVCTEDGKIAEVGVEDEREGDLLGNIHKGRVENIVPGMQAAFIACGLGRNGYLSLEEAGTTRFSTYDGEGNVSEMPSLKEGDELLVQIVKLPRGNKGAKVSTDLSFVGKYLIFLPQTDFLGISRKITDGETRKTLLNEADKLRKKGEGFIVRTAAQEATKRHLKTEAEYLRRMYRMVLANVGGSPVGTVLYRECSLPVKIMRDSPVGGVNKIYVGNADLYERVLQLARMRSDIGEKKVVLYDGDETMFARFGLADQILELAETRVDLESGYLVIDRTEAMTVIDVNTGSFTGESDLESTVFETNLQAAREIARQVRLRNIGGIVAVDFIDMAEEEHRAAVDAALAESLSADRAKCRAFPMNDLCVALFTRKRTNQDILSFLLKRCPHCARQGYVLSDRYMAMRIRSEIMLKFAEGYGAAIVDLNRTLMTAILKERYFEDDVNGRWKEKRVYFVPHSSYREEQFAVHGDNSRVLTLPNDAQILY